jgi:hypothetical protein
VRSPAHKPAALQVLSRARLRRDRKITEPFWRRWQRDVIGGKARLTPKQRSELRQESCSRALEERRVLNNLSF